MMHNYKAKAAIAEIDKLMKSSLMDSVRRKIDRGKKLPATDLMTLQRLSGTIDELERFAREVK